MSNQPYITCPVCESKIHFEPHALVTGLHFNCPECPDVSIGLNLDSRDVVKDGLDKFSDLKQRVAPDNP